MEMYAPPLPSFFSRLLSFKCINDVLPLTFGWATRGPPKTTLLDTLYSVLCHGLL